MTPGLRIIGWVVAATMLLWSGVALAADTSAPDGNINAWLLRVHEASKARAYTGTFVVSAGPKTASAKIWHICDGTHQMERVEPLSGQARSIFRRDDQVITFFPESRVAVTEKRDSLGLFPGLLKGGQSDISAHYQLKSVGSERMVGVEADIVEILPRDALRYGYRVWSEKRTGLVVQLQTLDMDGHVLEQAAFSELQLDAPVSMPKLTQMMGATDGYRIESPEMQKTTAEAQGWTLRRPVPGFRAMGCFLRPIAVAGQGATAMQWMFSDGLATVSLFVEPFDSRRHTREGPTDLGGATRTLTRHLDGWWVTVVGEVPAGTLSVFAQTLERRK